MSTILRNSAIMAAEPMAISYLSAVEVLYPDSDYNANLDNQAGSGANYIHVDENGTDPDDDVTYVYKAAGSDFDMYGIVIPSDGWDYWHSLSRIKFIRVWVCGRKTNASYSGNCNPRVGDVDGDVEGRFFEFDTSYQWYYQDFPLNYDSDPWEWSDINSSFRFGVTLTASVTGGEARVTACHCEIHYIVPNGEIIMPGSDGTTQLSTSSGTDHRALVDDVSPKFEEYVYTYNDATAKYDTFTMNNPVDASADTILGVTCAWRESSVAITSFGHGATACSQNTGTGVTSPYASHWGQGFWHTRTWAVNHFSDIPWTWTQVNAMTSGIRILGDTVTTVQVFSYFVIIHVSQQNSFDLDAWLEGGSTTYTETVNLDALIKKTLTTTVNLDSYLQQSLSVDVNLDSFLSQLASILTNLDSLLSKTDTSDVNLDSYLQGLASSTVNLDSILTAVGLTETINLDALLNATGLFSQANIDAILASATEKTIAFDALLNLAGIEATVSLDSFLQKIQGATINLDALLNAVGVTQTVQFDSYLVKALTAGVNIDSFLQSLGIEATVNIDAILAGGSTIEIPLDALLNATGLFSQAQVDAILQGSDTKTVNLDSLLQAVQDDKTINLDALLGELSWQNVTSHSIFFGRGTIESGDIWSLQNDDGNLVEISEVPLTYGLQYEMTFGENEAVPSTSIGVTIKGYYNGDVADNVSLLQWNYNLAQWDDVVAGGQDFPHETSEQTYQFHLLNHSDYIQAGQIKLKIQHSTAGTIGHRLWLDQVRLGLEARLDLDALIQLIGATVTSSLDAILGSGQEELVSLDAILSKILTGQINIDALLQESGITLTLNLDSLLQKAQSIGVQFDSLLNQAGAIQSNQDAYLVKEQLETVALDALLLTIFSKVVNLDAYLTKSQSLQTALDSLLTGTGEIVSNLDSIISKTNSLTVALDAIPVKTIEALTNLDALLNQVGQTTTVSLDAILGVLTAITTSIDAVLSKTGIIQVNLDKLLVGEKLAGASLDAVLVLALDNANSHYTFKTRLF